MRGRGPIGQWERGSSAGGKRGRLAAVRRARRLRMVPLLLLAACGGSANRDEEAGESAADAVVESSAPQEGSGAAPATGVPSDDRIAADPSLVSRVIIRSGSAVLEVPSLDRAVAELTRLVNRAGGYVAGTRVTGGEERQRQGQLSLRVPAERFDGLVSALPTVGEVKEVDVTSEDVGQEFTDVSARVANARRTEERMLELLRTRTGRLEDVLAVERELARVREEIERMEGRLRYLRTRAALSTLEVTLHEPEALLGGEPPAGTQLADALREAWRNLIRTVAGLIAALGGLIPLALLAAAGWWVYRRFRGRGRGDPR